MGIFSRLHLTLAAMAAAALLNGCADVTSTRPLPANPAPAHKQLLEGIWQAGADGGVFYIWFECNGVAHLATLDSAAGGVKMGQTDVFIARGRKVGVQEESGFLSVPEQILNPVSYPEELKNRRFYFAQYRFITPKDLLVWLPNPKPFEEAIRRGKLHGETDKHGGVKITSAPEELIAFMDDPDNLNLFRYREPFIFRKITDGEYGSINRCDSDGAKQQAPALPPPQAPQGSAGRR